MEIGVPRGVTALQRIGHCAILLGPQAPPPRLFQERAIGPIGPVNHGRDASQPTLQLFRQLRQLERLFGAFMSRIKVGPGPRLRDELARRPTQFRDCVVVIRAIRHMPHPTAQYWTR